jgi:hypothetical protein
MKTCLNDPRTIFIDLDCVKTHTGTTHYRGKKSIDRTMCGIRFNPNTEVISKDGFRLTCNRCANVEFFITGCD